MSSRPGSTHATQNIGRVLLLAVALLCAWSPFVHAQTEDAPDAVKQFEQGQDAHARNDYAAALRFYEAALKEEPEFPEAEYQRGTALVSLKRPSEAEQAFRRAIELRADWMPPLVALGRLVADDAIESKRAARLKEAEEILGRALKIEPSNVDVKTTLVRVTLLTGDDAATLKLLREVTTDATHARTKEAAWSWFLRATLERKLDGASVALKSLEQALALDPLFVEGYIERADLRLAADDLAGAGPDLLHVERLQKERFARERISVDSFEESVRLPSLHARLGEALRRTNPEQSLYHFGRALAAAPTNADYATGYAAALVQARRFDEAVKILRAVIDNAPDNYAAHANLATALDELKRYDEALAEYRWLRQRRPDIPVTDFLIARAYDLLKQYPEALAAYEAFLARADVRQNNLEIEKVNLRLPSLRRQAQQSKRGR